MMPFSPSTQKILGNFKVCNAPYALWASNALDESEQLVWQNDSFKQLDLDYTSFPFLAG